LLPDVVFLVNKDYHNANYMAITPFKVIEGHRYWYQRKAQKGKTAVFQLKSHFAWRKSATKFFCVQTVSDKVVMHSLAYLSVR